MSLAFWIMIVVYVVGAGCGIVAAVRDAGFDRRQLHAWRVWQETGKAEDGWPKGWLWGCDHVVDVSSYGGVVFKMLRVIVHGAHVHDGASEGGEGTDVVRVVRGGGHRPR